MITKRHELHFTCDGPCESYDTQELLLDDLDAKSFKGMFAKAKILGWTWDKNNCWCPDCSKKRK